MKKPIILATFALTLGLSVACGDDRTSTPDAGLRPDAAGSGDAGTVQCGEGNQHQQIINAPTTAASVAKVPKHPPIGPGGLP